jgi:hypothetical protein
MAIKKAAAPKISKASAAVSIKLPALKRGEVNIGYLVDQNGKPECHVIVLPGEMKSGTFDQAQAWAKKQGGTVLNLRELGLGRVNGRHLFKDEAYWSCEPHASDAGSAWFQLFSYGYRTSLHKSAELRARAVRRVKI